MSHRGRVVAGWLLVVLLIWGASYLLLKALTPYGMHTMPDSLAYMEAAENLAAGHGMSQTHFTGIGEEVSYLPFTTWPPLYPALLALVSKVTGEPIFSAAGSLNITLLVMMVLLLFTTVWRFFGIPMAAIASGVTLSSIPVVTTSAYVWSEGLFIFLSVAMLFLWGAHLQAAAEQRQQIARWYLLGLVGVLILLAYSRYIGLFYLIMLPVAWLFIRDRSAYLRSYLFGLVAYVVAALFLLGRNYLYTGFFSGAPRMETEVTLSENLMDVATTLYFMFVVDGPVSALCLLIAVMAVGGVLYFNQEKERDDSSVAQQLLVGVAVAILTYLIALVVMRTLSGFDRIDIRLLSPIAPLLVILFAGVLKRAMFSKSRGWVLCAPALLALMLMMGFKGLLLAQEVEKAVEDGNLSPFPMGGEGHYNSFTVDEERNLFRGVATSYAGYLAITDMPRFLDFQTGGSLEIARFDADLCQRLRNVERPYLLVLFTQGARVLLSYQYDRTVLRQGLDTRYSSESVMVINGSGLCQ